MSVYGLTILGCLSVVSSGIYGLVYTNRPTSVLRSVIKAVPVGSLALICGLAGGPILLTLALSLGALGDIFLSRDGQSNFLIGLVAFLFGHLAYIFVLVGLSGGLGNGLVQLAGEAWRIAASLLLIGLAGFVLRQLTPHLNALKLPVYVYAAVILGMGLAALALPGSWPLAAATVGAMLFIASDAILGFEIFVFKPAGSARRWPAHVLWFLYWGGQTILMTAVLLS